MNIDVSNLNKEDISYIYRSLESLIKTIYSFEKGDINRKELLRSAEENHVYLQLVVEQAELRSNNK